MRKRALFALATLSAMALMAVAPSFAQEGVEATIPFAFNVGSTTLPAGHYEVRRALASALVIQNGATHEAALALTTADSPEKTQGDAVLVFHKYGDACFLSAVQAGDSRRALGASKTEREAAEKAAETADDRPSRNVYVAAFTH